jgi:pyruvate,water dikinase
VAFTEADHEDDLVESVEGLAEALVRGGVRGETWALPKLRRFERRGGPLASAGPRARLQALLREVRRVFGAGDLDLEWADDGGTCWLLQVRPVTAPTIRDEVFTVANHKEILPDLPSRLMSDVLRTSAGALFGWYRRFDRELPRARPFLELFAGRPRINLGLLTDTMRIWGLTTRLVTDSIGGPGLGPEPLRLPRLLRKLPVLLRLGIAQLLAVPTAARIRRRIAARAADPGGELAAVAATLGAVYVDLVHGMFGLTAAMSGPLALLRRTGTLAAHSSAHRTVSTRAWDELELVRGRLDESARRACAGGAWPADPAAVRAIEGWLGRHGHRGPFESDIERPRFAEDPTAVLRALGVAPAAGRVRGRRSLAAWLTWPLWRLGARPALAAREELRSDAMRAFLAIRRRLLELGRAAVAAGRLPAAEDLFALEIADLVRLDRGASITAEEVAARRRGIEADRARRLPDLFRRRAPFDSAAGPARAGALLRGLGLTRGVAEGIAFVAADPAEPLPEGVDPRGLVLVAPAVDAGWIPLLSSVAAAVIETGGELSHGSIVIREVGLPAVTNVDGALATIRSGERLTVHADAGEVERCEPGVPSAQLGP